MGFPTSFHPRYFSVSFLVCTYILSVQAGDVAERTCVYTALGDLAVCTGVSALTSRDHPVQLCSVCRVLVSRKNMRVGSVPNNSRVRANFELVNWRRPYRAVRRLISNRAVRLLTSNSQDVLSSRGTSVKSLEPCAVCRCSVADVELNQHVVASDTVQRGLSLIHI